MPCTADWKALKIVTYAGASPLPQLPWRPEAPKGVKTGPA